MAHVWETGQICKGWIDVLVENDAGMIVIDHKITRDDPAAVVRKHAGQLLAYKQAVEVATGKPADCWIHYPVSGHLVRLE
jgi:hypothetical protein